MLSLLLDREGLRSDEGVPYPPVSPILNIKHCDKALPLVRTAS